MNVIFECCLPWFFRLWSKSASLCLLPKIWCSYFSSSKVLPEIKMSLLIPSWRSKHLFQFTENTLCNPDGLAFIKRIKLSSVEHKGWKCVDCPGCSFPFSIFSSISKHHNMTWELQWRKSFSVNDDLRFGLFTMQIYKKTYIECSSHMYYFYYNSLIITLELDGNCLFSVPLNEREKQFIANWTIPLSVIYY